MNICKTTTCLTKSMLCNIENILHLHHTWGPKKDLNKEMNCILKNTNKTDN